MVGIPNSGADDTPNCTSLSLLRHLDELNVEISLTPPTANQSRTHSIADPLRPYNRQKIVDSD